MRRMWSLLVSVALVWGTVPMSLRGADGRNAKTPNPDSETTTIKHVVLIFDENISFDHYFGTYPKVTNPGGEPAFFAAPDTPKVNGLSQTLISSNHNQSQQSPDWKDMTIIITYDDSDGWHDHVMPPIVNHSADPSRDTLLGTTGFAAEANRSQRAHTWIAVAMENGCPFW